MKILKLLVLSCFCWSLLGGIGFAEKSEFKDVNYSFAKLKSIPVTCMIDNDAQKFIENEYADKVVLQSLLENAKKKLVPLFDSYGLEKQYALLHSDYVEQKNKDEAKAQTVLAQYLKNNFDANLTVVVKKYHYDYVEHEGYTYESTEYQEIKIKNSDGTWTTISQPYKKTNYVDPWTEKIAVVKLEFKLTDNKTGDVIFARTDEKSSSGGVFSSPNVDKVAGKVCETYINDLSKMIKGK